MARTGQHNALWRAGAVAAAIAASALSAHADTVNFEFLNDRTSVASGSFSYDAGAPSVVHFGDLTSFSFTAFGQTTTLADVQQYIAGHSTYVHLAFDTTSQTFIDAAVAGYPSVMAATSADLRAGFFVDSLHNPNPGPDATVAGYAPYRVANWHDLTIDVVPSFHPANPPVPGVPEPGTWAMMLAGIAAVVARGARRRA